MYEVSEDDVTRAKNQFKAMQLFGIDSTAGASFVPAFVCIQPVRHLYQTLAQ